MSAFANWARIRETDGPAPSLSRLPASNETQHSSVRLNTFESQARTHRPPSIPPHRRMAVRRSRDRFGNFQPRNYIAAQGILARNGVETEVISPGCGDAAVEQGDNGCRGEGRKVADELGRIKKDTTSSHWCRVVH